MYILSVMDQGDGGGHGGDEAVRGSALSLLKRTSPLSAHANDLRARGDAVGRGAEDAGGSHSY